MFSWIVSNLVVFNIVKDSNGKFIALLYLLLGWFRFVLANQMAILIRLMWCLTLALVDNLCGDEVFCLIVFDLYRMLDGTAPIAMEQVRSDSHWSHGWKHAWNGDASCCSPPIHWFLLQNYYMGLLQEEPVRLNITGQVLSRSWHQLQKEPVRRNTAELAKTQSWHLCGKEPVRRNMTGLVTSLVSHDTSCRRDQY
jgi:hypothetical protein